MKYTGPIRSEIPAEFVTREIRWLEIHDGDGGFYLYQLREENAPPQWDSFCGDFNEVVEDCRRIWNVPDDAWKLISTSGSSL